MKLLSPDREKAFYARIKKAHDRLVSGVLAGDLPEVAYASGYLSSTDPKQEVHLPSVPVMRRKISAGEVPSDRHVATSVRDALTDSAKGVRDRLVAKVRLALRDAATTLRQRKLSGRAFSEAKRVATAFVREQVNAALSSAEREWHLAVGVAIHDAAQEGRAKRIHEAGGRKARVYKQVQPGACRFCIRFYTTDGVKPRIFRLEALAANGSNVGRKAADWRPVLGSTHPNCRCVLYPAPASPKTRKK